MVTSSQPVATGWHSIETNDAVVGSVVSVAALDRLIAVALGQGPATPDTRFLAISQRDQDFTLADRVLWGLHRLNWRRLFGRVDRGLIGSRLMRNEKPCPGWFDADGEIVDGGEPGGGAVSRKVNVADGTASKTTVPSPSSSQPSNPNSTMAKHAPGSGCSAASTAMTVRRPGVSPGSVTG